MPTMAQSPSASESSRCSIRESMAVLPGPVQPFLTWLTGRPLPDEEPWNLTGMSHLLSAVASLILGVTLGILAATQMGWWLLLLYPSWLCTVHSVRKLRAMISHQCSHSNFSGNETLDDVIGEITSVVFMTQNYFAYKREHILGHHSKKHMTLEDPTVAFMVLMVGARAGMSRDELWHQLLKMIVSPVFHARFIWVRLKSNFLHTSWWHRALILLVWGGMITVTALTGAWHVFLLAWVLPLTLVLHVAESLRLCGRHVFPEVVKHDGRSALAGYTHGIFIGDRVPDSRLPPLRKVSAWVVWFLRILFVHLPSRMLVIVGDSPCHDYHHRFPSSTHWANYIFAREQDLQAGAPGWPDYTEVWGVRAAIDATFESLSKASPEEYDPKRLGKVSTYELLEAFEE